MALFCIHDSTDVENDVSFAYDIMDGDEKYYVMISMLGSYAVLLENTPGYRLELVTQETASKMAKRIWSRLEDYGLAIFSKEQLEMPVNIELEDIEPENVTVYHAMFTHIAGLPWEPSQPDESNPLNPDSTMARIGRFFNA